MARPAFDLSGLEADLAVIVEARARALAACGAPVIASVDAAARIILDRLPPGRRSVVGLAGCPASGKTTAAQALVALLNADRAERAAHLPMDGFHLRSEILAARDLDRIKGDISTYDVAAYAATLRRFKDFSHEAMRVPDYVRAIHDVVPDALEIPAAADLLITEGIYVGTPDPGWEGVRCALDLLFFLDTPPQDCAARIIARNQAAGRSDAVIRHKLRNDLGFMRRSIRILDNAGFVIRIAG